MIDAKTVLVIYKAARYEAIQCKARLSELNQRAADIKKDLDRWTLISRACNDAICPICDGEGKRWINFAQADDTKLEACTACNGTGFSPEGAEQK